MKTLDLDTALELSDGLCRGFGVNAEERARIFHEYDDEMLAWLFDIYSMLSGLFQDQAVVQKFIREPQKDLTWGGCSIPRTVARAAFSGSRNLLQLAREYVQCLAGVR